MLKIKTVPPESIWPYTAFGYNSRGAVARVLCFAVVWKKDN